MGRNERGGWECARGGNCKVKSRTLKTAGMRHPKVTEFIEGAPPACHSLPNDMCYNSVTREE
jgi:hypothetical protein